MLSFPEEFFEAEERCDFYVSSTMKRYWACCMEIVNQIDIVCKRHNIEYYADWGTMLGAVRHQGFIPWDDDMDIAVKRPDYERLLKYLEEELPEGYKVSSSYNSQEHRQFFAGVSNGKVMDLSKERVNKFYGCPFVAVIDIFPLDYLPRDKETAEVLKNLFVVIWNVVDLIQKEASPEEIEEAVCIVEDFLNIKFERNDYIRSQMWKIANQLVSSYTEEESDTLVQWAAYVNKNQSYDKHWYDEKILLPFENYSLPVPKHYEEILEVMFGDWRTPVKMAAGHDYPCFKKQLQFMRDFVKNNT